MGRFEPSVAHHTGLGGTDVPTQSLLFAPSLAAATAALPQAGTSAEQLLEVLDPAGHGEPPHAVEVTPEGWQFAIRVTRLLS